MSEPGARRGRTLHLHIGLPKTATTYLQTAVFPRLTRVRYVGTPTSDRFSDPEDREVGGRILSCALKRAVAIWRHNGAELFAAMLGPACQEDRRDVLISDEGVGRAGSRPSLLAAHLSAIRSHALSSGFDNVTVLCVVRRQDHWFASHYAQVSDRIAGASQADFEREAAALADPWAARFRLGMLLDYVELRDALTEAVGAECVTMIPFEMLADAPSVFSGALSEALGEAMPTASPDGGDRNARSRGGETWLLRRPRGGGRATRALARLRRPATIALTPAVSATILTAFAASNRSFEADAGVNLARYGYF